MKIRLFLILSINVCLLTKLYSQPNVFPSSGNVGIGTNTPIAKLDLKGDLVMTGAALGMGLTSEVGGTTPLLNMDMNFRVPNRNNDYMGAGFRIDARAQNIPLFQWLYRPPGTSTESVLMNLTSTGNLGLGVIDPVEKLAINGNIRAKEVKVESNNWPDYVFSEEYKLTKLQELEEYIKKNKHLPEMPSAKEMEAKGLSIGEMMHLQQEKIEELTLHLIEKDKQLQQEKETNKKQQQQINQVISELHDIRQTIGLQKTNH